MKDLAGRTVFVTGAASGIGPLSRPPACDPSRPFRATCLLPKADDQSGREAGRRSRRLSADGRPTLAGGGDCAVVMLMRDPWPWRARKAGGDEANAET